MSDNTAAYGFTALPADQSQDKPATDKPQPMVIRSLQPPTTPLATRVTRYVQTKLDADTYRHSLRVYSWGLAIARQCFPHFELTPGSKLEETWYLTAMLHDIGTCDFLTETRLSYEFFAGIHAFDLLQNPWVTGGEGIAPREQAESVVEAILRHQDVQDKGKITLMTRLIHWGTLLDNIGAVSQYVHPETLENVIKEYPRPGWSGCFKRTVEKEKKVKPYAMVSRIEGFEEVIEKNGSEGGLMAKHD
jgi:cyanamide hydratase